MYSLGDDSMLVYLCISIVSIHCRDCEVNCALNGENGIKH